MLALGNLATPRIGARMALQRLGFLLLLVLANCDYDPTPPLGPDQPSASEVASASVTWREAYVSPTSIDAFFLQVNDEVPGFGGRFIADGHPVIFVEQASQSEQVRQALQPMLERRQLASIPPEVRTADYEWRELSLWRAELMDLLADPAVVSLDVNESLNRVQVGVLDPADQDRISSEIGSRDIPSEAIRFQVTVPGKSLADLTDRTRPLVGGLRINNNPPNGRCTLGFNTVWSGNARFMTNSHCTDSLFASTGMTMYQSDLNASGHRVGYESWDPAPYWNITCQSAGGSSCRWSDAALATYDDSVTAVKGRIAKTTSADRLNGSTTVDGHFSISDKYTQIAQGDTLHKMGSVTGWTYGDVAQTCVHQAHDRDPSVLMVCQDIVNAGVAHGDSGSPVFFRNGGTDIELAGILWAGRYMGTDSVQIYISSIGNIEEDFGTSFDVEAAPPLTTWIVGPSQVRPNTSCTWQAFTSGGESPHYRVWSGVLSGSGTQNWISGTVSSSGMLNVEVTSDDGQVANDSFYIEVTSSAPECVE